MLLLGLLAGAFLGFAFGRSLTYERWLTERRELAQIRRRQEIHQQLQRRSTHAVIRRANAVAQPPAEEAG